MPRVDTPSDAPLIQFNTSAAGTADVMNFSPQQYIVATGFDGPWHPSLSNFLLVSAANHRALLLERIMDEELPRFAEALKRLGEWTT
jgi:hypothetical protein